MSPIRRSSLAFAIVLSFCAMALSGCGDKNSQADLNPSTGKHPADWIAPSGHPVAAQNHLIGCIDCHGNDFTGGISKVACTQCHLGNQFEVHPLQWGQFAYALHGAFVQQNGTGSCANVSCHGAGLTGVAGSGPSCTSCHLGGPTSAHPLTWNIEIILHSTYVGQNGTAACQNATCHGASLQGVFLSGPSCNTCHAF